MSTLDNYSNAYLCCFILIWRSRYDFRVRMRKCGDTRLILSEHAETIPYQRMCYLTHWPLGDMIAIWKCNLRERVLDWVQGNLLWNYQVNSIGHVWWLVIIGPFIPYGITGSHWVMIVFKILLRQTSETLRCGNVSRFVGIIHILISGVLLSASLWKPPWWMSLSHEQTSRRTSGGFIGYSDIYSWD